MMVLYKATEAGNVPMTKEEEDEIRSEWEKNKGRKVKSKTIEERIADCEARLKKLEKA
jgi:hypothetical protein